MTDTRPRKPKRRWYQFRLRTLLLVTLVLGVLSGWIGNRVQRARKNRQSLAEVGTVVQEAGGRAWLGYVEQPDWLGRLLGDPGVLYLSCRAPIDPPSFDDVDLEHLMRSARAVNGLASLERLDLNGTRVTDAGLEHVKGLTNLQWLCLTRTKVTDAGLVHLEGLTNLQWLELNNTKITDVGLVHLKGLSSMTHLHLQGTKVTDAGLKHLRELNLTYLDLRFTHVTDGGVKSLDVTPGICLVEY